MKNYIVLLVGVLIVICSACKEEDLLGTSGDTIQLSQKEFSINCSADTIIINTVGTGWWICAYAVNNKVYNLTFKDQSDTIQGEWFPVLRPENNRLIIYIDENNQPKIRKLEVGLHGGNYFDAVVITQNSFSKNNQISSTL